MMLKAKIINPATHEFYEAQLQPQPDGPPECLIGRHPSCDLVLDDPTVSRVHGRILFQQKCCYFVDLGSTDGSRLNNEVMAVNQPYALNSDDVIRLGDFALLVEAVEPLQASLQQVPQQASMADLSVRCVQIIQETCDVKTFRFKAEPSQWFDYKPGQFVTFQLDINGEKVPRSYSISSSPSRPYMLEVTVKRVPAAGEGVPPGLVSNWLHDHVTVGKTLHIQGPYGQFNCIDHPADQYLFISAGSGITPMMSMVQWLCDNGSKAPIIFIHSARTATDLIFRQRLELLAVQHPNLQLAWILTQPISGIAWSGYRGRLNETLLKSIAPNYGDFTTFVCGPQSFMLSVRDLFERLNFPMDYYLEESFGAPKKSHSSEAKTPPPSHPQSDQKLASNQSVESKAPVVVFQKSGQEIACDADDSLLEIAERAGIELTSGCRMGSCGVCKHQLLSGQVQYDEVPSCLTQDEQQNGLVLACVAQPVGRVVLSA